MDNGVIIPVGFRVVYSLLMFVTMLVAFLMLRRNQRALPLTTHQRMGLGLAAFTGTMIGAKVPFLMDQGIEGIATGTIWFADGKTILGGIFGGYLAIELIKRILAIRVSTGDSFALPVAIAVFVGRIGCFIGGCCFGTITTLPWGVHFATAGDSPDVCRHPTQLYEALFHLLAAGILAIAQRKQWWLGNQLKVYLLAYLGYRFVTEWIRPPSLLFLGLTTYQWSCLGLACCLVFLWDRNLSTRKHQAIA